MQILCIHVCPETAVQSSSECVKVYRNKKTEMLINIVSQKQNHAMQNSVKFLHNANVCDHFCSQNVGIFKYDMI